MSHRSVDIITRPFDVTTAGPIDAISLSQREAVRGGNRREEDRASARDMVRARPGGSRGGRGLETWPRLDQGGHES